MKKQCASVLLIASSICLLAGCMGGLSLGGGSKTVEQRATVGQQVIDLKKARDAGALTENEYQAQKQKILASK